MPSTPTFSPGPACQCFKWAERKNATPAQIALAWLMAQKPWIVPIHKTTHMEHMHQNIGADAIRFTPAELAELNESVAAIEIRGQRLPDAVLAFSDVESPPEEVKDPRLHSRSRGHY